jgi:internalin A
MSTNELLWEKLEHQLSLNVPKLQQRLRPPSSLEQIQLFESKTNLVLPDDLRNAYLRHDGCEFDGASQGHVGFFGDIEWLSLSDSLERQQSNWQFFNEDDPYFYGPDDGEWDNLPIRPWQGPPTYWVPVGKCYHCAIDIYADLMPGPTGRVGQLVIQNIHGMSTGVLADSWTSYVEWLINGLENRTLNMVTQPDSSIRRWGSTKGEEIAKPKGGACVFG